MNSLCNYAYQFIMCSYMICLIIIAIVCSRAEQGIPNESHLKYNFFLFIVCLIIYCLVIVSECRCNPYGSTGRTCHRNTGNCFCRANVMGRACDRCTDGFWNLETGTGCQSCDCNAGGSRDGNCSAYTGQCNCKTGVSGTKCDQCVDGFYGFSSNGCKRKFYFYQLMLYFIFKRYHR
jgi:hypothetical protein